MIYQAALKMHFPFTELLEIMFIEMFKFLEQKTDATLRFT